MAVPQSKRTVAARLLAEAGSDLPRPGSQGRLLVMTEVLNADGTPHVSNGRATIDDDDDISGLALSKYFGMSILNCPQDSQ